MYAVVPEQQRRSLAELDERLNLSAGDRAAKRSAFWVMLTLSAVIAVAGVVGDSTATVIGAMITFPITAGVTVLLYIDQRIRREALDLDLARAAGVQDYGSGAPGATAGG